MDALKLSTLARANTVLPLNQIVEHASIRASTVDRVVPREGL